MRENFSKILKSPPASKISTAKQMHIPSRAFNSLVNGSSKSITLFLILCFLSSCKGVNPDAENIQESVEAIESEQGMYVKAETSTPLLVVDAGTLHPEDDASGDGLPLEQKLDVPTSEIRSITDREASTGTETGGLTPEQEEEAVIENAMLENQMLLEQERIDRETTIISENLDLFNDMVIQNKRVIFDKVVIRTFEHDLFILADEFISDNSIIQNFSPEQIAKRAQDGRSGGNILIEAISVKGNVKLILNGERGGSVSRRKISNRQLNKLSGRKGRRGQNAVYRNICNEYVAGLFTTGIICGIKCIARPTNGENGEDGVRGFRGFDGKNGGNSGSLLVKAFDTSEFVFAEVKQTPGFGSKGGRGSYGGEGGRGGRPGRDRSKLCYSSTYEGREGDDGDRGKRGEKGKDGEKGTVCIEKISSDKEIRNQKIVVFGNLSLIKVCDETEKNSNCMGKQIAKVELPKDAEENKEGLICY